MQDPVLIRKKEGEVLLAEQLVKVATSAETFLNALKGFRRDLPLSIQASKYFSADFSEPAHILVVPKLFSGMSFADLRQMLTLCEGAIDGAITIKNPPMGPIANDKEKLLEEIMITHKNLLDTADAAYQLYQTLQSACFEFDVFNTKNIEVGEIDANILFERDSLNVGRALSRALSERAIRLDIDLMQARKEVETGDTTKDI